LSRGTGLAARNGNLVGEPKYPEGFERFDYVNPDAPKAAR
jgi:microcin C transport system substrate-binding protein